MHEERLLEATFKDDEPVELSLVPDPRADGTNGMSIAIAEGLYCRLRFLALAYQLPLLGRLPTAGDWTFPDVQLATIEDELLFLAATVLDPALSVVVRRVVALIGPGIRQPGTWSLLVSCP